MFLISSIDDGPCPLVVLMGFVPGPTVTPTRPTSVAVAVPQSAAVNLARSQFCNNSMRLDDARNTHCSTAKQAS